MPWESIEIASSARLKNARSVYKERVIFPYTSYEQHERKLRKILFKLYQKNKIFKNELTKRSIYLYFQKYKILLKKLKKPNK